MKNANIYDTKIGKIMIAENGSEITDLVFADRFSDHKIKLCETALLREAVKQLTEYLEGHRREFTIPINPDGTMFQKKVWDTLRNIPFGETRSYKQIAEAIGNAKAYRAVGMANNKNPILFMIPCHRVIGTNGKLVGFACGLEIKDYLLKLEQRKDGNL